MTEENGPINLCPVCGFQSQHVYPLSEQAKVMAGAFTVCYGCGAILVFNQDLKLRRLTRDEMGKLRDHPQAWGILMSAQELILTRN